ncbi:DEAD/DEAH box helicase [Komagataeibacter oboediens]|uniref:DEAD/DEAH box helicase n=1 Tax=Komagataeibacter oboediens TaxID=65958 RepID=UPI001C2CF889|nr:DEAD/DEAH box helicase [Komagataeibacter oboediens]
MAGGGSFRGLFIGIDRYASAAVGELSCARRDAVALEALFADTLGGSTTLLVDADATRARIGEAFAELAQCDADDTVVIAYSGHGSETHELVVHDTDVTDLAATAVSLDVLETWFAAIPARRLILLLDCCFSGGIGSKVLAVPTRPRDPRSTAARLDQLAGHGRLVFTASAADEAAWEHMRHGHGFLTFYLIEALRGAEEVVWAGKLSVYRLLEHVTERVKAAARQIGRPQSPAVRGTIDGEFQWPVFVRGARFAAAFPERAPTRVTANLSTLTDVGFPRELVDAWGAAIFSLNQLQVDAINDFGVLDGEHLVVSAPTSSGKTMIGELAALRAVLGCKRAIFLLPLKALVADKRRHFERVYGAFGVRTIEATGETDDISPILSGRYDIALMTYEKFAAIALTHPHVLAQAGVIVVDEAQMIADVGRGANLEFILTLVRMRRRGGVEPQLIALSAVIGDTNGLEQWLGARLLRRSERPVPLAEGVLRGDGSFRYLDPNTGEEQVDEGFVRREFCKRSSQDWVIPLVRRLTGEGQQVIVFREIKGETRGCASYLAEALGLPSAAGALARLPAGDPSRASADLRGCLTGGVAFHNADLERDERRVIEEEFRKEGSNLRVIAATTTLAMGVNTPASSVVIVGLMHPGGQAYSVAEYKNLVGRAGRLGFAEKGTSYLLALDPRSEHDLWNRYVLGVPEDLVSRFLDPATDPRSLIVRVLVAAQRAAGEGVLPQEIVAFLEASFGAFQAQRQQDRWRWDHDDLIRALGDLHNHGLVEENADGTYCLTSLGRLAGESAIEVESIVRLVGALRGLDPRRISDPLLIAAAQLTVELDRVLFPMNKRSTQKEPQVWPAELRRQGVPVEILGAFGRSAADQHQPTLRAKKAVACLLFVSGQAMDEVERALTQFGGAFGGAAGPIRNAAARTSDLIPVTARLAELLHPALNLGDRIGRLVVRLTYGVAAPAVDLARVMGGELARGDYCRLVAAGLVEPVAIRAADDARLLKCLDNNTAKLHIVREAAERIEAAVSVSPLLKPYEE